MKDTEKAQVARATETLGRVRKVSVRFRVYWTRLDDLPPEDERSLTGALRASWDLWAQEHGVAEADARGPDVLVHKLDYVPAVDGELPVQ